MKNDILILLLAAMTVVGCRQTQSNSVTTSQAEAAAIVSDSHDNDSCRVYPYKYKDPINGYKVQGELKMYDSAEHMYSEDILFFTNIETGESFSIQNSIFRSFISESDLEDLEREYTSHSSDKEGIITAPYEDFFFADLDFDGKEELIAGILPQGASQRGVGLFTDIYKIIDGDIVNYTEHFQAKSDIFNHIEQYFFEVCYKTKSIIFYSSGGASYYGWDIYDYINGDYVYRYYVSVEEELLWEEDFAQISIYSSPESRKAETDLIARYMVHSDNLYEFMYDGVLANNIDGILDKFYKEAVITDKFTYKETINGYRVTGDIRKSLANDTTLHFHHIASGNKFSVRGGHSNHILYQSGENEYTPLLENDGLQITAPSELFFFADLDFDGEDELITEISPFIDPINDIWRLSRIYKIVNGKPIDYTEFFTKKCDVFNHMDSYCFTINYQTKSFRFNYHDKWNKWDWDIYDYKNGNYLHRHYVSTEELANGEKYQVSIYPTIEDKESEQNLLKRFIVSRDEFFDHHWEY